MTLKEKQYRLKIISIEMDALREAHSRYQKLAFERGDLAEEIETELQEQKLSSLKRQTQFEDCIFPEIGSGGVNGNAFFDTEEIAKELCEGLHTWHSSYWYTVTWSGPEMYTLLPKTEYRVHDGWKYVGTFVKESND